MRCQHSPWRIPIGACGRAMASAASIPAKAARQLICYFMAQMLTHECNRAPVVTGKASTVKVPSLAFARSWKHGAPRVRSLPLSSSCVWPGKRGTQAGQGMDFYASLSPHLRRSCWFLPVLFSLIPFLLFSISLSSSLSLSPPFAEGGLL